MLHQLLGAPGKDDPRFKLMKAIFSAIARHHSPTASTYKSFVLHKAAGPTLAQVLAGLNVGEQAHEALVTNKDSQYITGFLVQPDARDELLAYFLIVRALRLADQGAMAVNE